jgi:hypothetical protein
MFHLVQADLIALGADDFGLHGGGFHQYGTKCLKT